MMHGFARALAAPAVMAAAMTAAGPVAAQDVKGGVDAWGRGDYRAAVEQWRGPAVAGDADAQYNLGQAYKLGRGVPVDPALAESWFRKAALQGHYQAQENYGLALFTAGKKTDAVPWLEKAVARDSARGEIVLGTMLFNGDGVPRDYPRAYALMTRASQQGLKSASETLAQMDQYIAPADRQKGVAMAQAMATAPRPVMPATPSRAVVQSPPRAVASTTVPPSRAATPTPAPRPTPVAKAAPTPAPVRTSSGGWRVQLGAFSSQANAQTQWARVRGKLGGAQPFYVPAGKIVRLQAGGFGSKAEAQRACSASGVGCVVVAP